METQMLTGKPSDFTPRSLIYIENKIQANQNKREQTILLAKKAGCLARNTRIPEAKNLTKELQTANIGHDPRLSGWLLYAEGLIEHFGSLNNSKSQEKFNRALSISRIALDKELTGVAAAWLAHCELVCGDIPSTVANLVTAFEWLGPENGEARGRASMVLADTLNWAGRNDLARIWYKIARQHAIQDGDIAMQNVMIFNTAAFGVASLTIRDCQGALSPQDWRFISLEVASSKNLHFALGVEALASTVSNMQAELFVVQKKWLEALTLFNENITQAPDEGQQRVLSKLLAQRAWCKANLGDNLGAENDINATKLYINDCVDLDDLAILNFRLSAAAELIGDSVAEAHHKETAIGYFDRFKQQQIEIQHLIFKAFPKIDSK